MPSIVKLNQAKLETLEQELLKKYTRIESWIRSQWLKHNPPFYGSVDLRNAGYKISPIDMNLFPGGFNNLNSNYTSGAVIAIQDANFRLCPDAESILIIPENHTRNPFYLENIYALAQIITQAGFQVRIGSLNPEIQQDETFLTALGHQITLEPVFRKRNRIYLADGFSPCSILLNNDLSAGIPDILKDLDQKVAPPVYASWTLRRKSYHFEAFDHVISEFAQAIDIDPWSINPYFTACSNLNFQDKYGNELLVDSAADLLNKIQLKYNQEGIKDEPFIIMKADSGTYGMGIMTIKDPNDLLSLNRKNRNKMATIKDGLKVSDVILQEGVYSYEEIDGAVAEPVVYMIDKYVVGGFYRAHKGRTNYENLNASGMQFFPLSTDISNSNPKDEMEYADKRYFSKWDSAVLPNISDLMGNNQSNHFYVYGMIARLSLLASSLELEIAKQKYEQSDN